MAEPIPVYPQPELGPQAGIDVAHRTSSTSNSDPVSIFDRTFLHAGRSLWQTRDADVTALSGIKRTAIYVAEERPIQLVLGVAIAAFVAGSGLRIWRSHHE